MYTDGQLVMFLLKGFSYNVHHYGRLRYSSRVYAGSSRIAKRDMSIRLAVPLEASGGVYRARRS